jgi:hypothetical protein
LPRSTLEELLSLMGVERHDLIADRATAYHVMGLVSLWTQPVTTGIEFNRAAFRAARETEGVAMACYSMYHIIDDLLVRNDPLDEVWAESERGLDFVANAKFLDVADIIRGQQRFIATMRGRTASFSTFTDAQFDEAAFEARLTPDRSATMVCLYWIVKLKTDSCQATTPRRSRRPTERKRCSGPRLPRSIFSTTFTTVR